MKQHGGWIEVKSKVGEGAIFNVFLPACLEQQRAASTIAPRPMPRGQETILYVEDDESLRQIMVMGLRGMGYHVLEASNGANALQLWNLHKGQIALLLTDMVMPGGMTGLELAKQLRQMEGSFKVIISSGYSLELSQLQENTELGFTYLNKPYQMTTLATAVRECLDKPQHGLERSHK